MSPEERIIAETRRLLAQGDIEAVTTRAVSAAAKVQPPTLYRHFGDMQGLLQAAASREFAEYLSAKRERPREPDPIDDLRKGWDHHVEFALTKPAAYTLMYLRNLPGRESEAETQGGAILRRLLERAAEAGRLTVPVERAQAMLHSACKGVAITLMSLPEARRDHALSTATREAILAAIATAGSSAEAPADPLALVSQRAIALKAVLERSTALTEAESRLFREWLDRLANEPRPARGDG